MNCTVELWYAPLPAPLSRFAWHHWFVVHAGDVVERWEIWQTQNAGGENIGHLHKNLMGPTHGVGGGAAVCLCSWTDEEAKAIYALLHGAQTQYPYRFFYLAFPGPNSNTFVQWILQNAGLKRKPVRLPWQAIGKIWWFPTSPL